MLCRPTKKIQVTNLTSERRNILFGFPSSSEKKIFFFSTQSENLVCLKLFAQQCFDYCVHTDITNIMNSLTLNYNNVITNITKGCDYDGHFVLHFCSLQKVFLASQHFVLHFCSQKTETRQKCAELATKAQITSFMQLFRRQDDAEPAEEEIFFSSSKRRQGRPQTERSVSNTLQTTVSAPPPPLSREEEKLFRRQDDAEPGKKKFFFFFQFQLFSPASFESSRVYFSTFFGARTTVSATPPPLSQGKRDNFFARREGNGRAPVLHR